MTTTDNAGGPNLAAAAPAKPKDTGAVYLPVLPEGWAYAVVVVQGPGDAVVAVTGTGTGYTVQLTSETLNPKPAKVPTLHEAVRTAGKAAFEYAKVAATQEALKAQLAGFGADVFGVDKPAPRKRAPRAAKPEGAGVLDLTGGPSPAPPVEE